MTQRKEPHLNPLANGVDLGRIGQMVREIGWLVPDSGIDIGVFNIYAQIKLSLLPEDGLLVRNAVSGISCIEKLQL